ncbi:MAG: TetR/AcrR family transcriptional regulator [Kosmotoga sp.]|nr:MAG: TetR/AcrR family transcriptional regulator [Kosmotoga sp.]
METKERILRESLKLFSNKGYSGTSMNEIAETIGIKKPSLYFHFKSKKEIFRTLFDEVVKDHLTEVKKLLRRIESLSEREKLYGFFKGYLKYFKESEYVEFWNRMYYFPPVEFKEEIYEKTAEVEEHMKSQLELIIKDGIKNKEIKKDDSKKLLTSYYYMLLGFMLSLNDYKGKSINEDVDRCMEVFWDVVKNEGD